MTDTVTLTFTARWRDLPTLGWSQLLICPYAAEAWTDGEWSVRVNGVMRVEAPAFRGGDMAAAKAAAIAWIQHHHTTTEAAA